MFLIRGIVFSYEAVRDWEAKLASAIEPPQLEGVSYDKLWYIQIVRI
jgi:hypothetical protein